MSIVASLAIAGIVMAIIAAGYAALAVRVGRRHGRTAIVLLWAFTSAVVAGAFVWRLGRLQAGRSIPEFAAAPFPIFWQFLAFFALGLGAVSAFIARRQRRGRTSIDGQLVLRSMGAFFGGVVLWMLAYAAWEARRLL